jgi:hypothetical protein
MNDVEAAADHDPDAFRDIFDPFDPANDLADCYHKIETGHSPVKFAEEAVAAAVAEEVIGVLVDPQETTSGY